jgi:hypothetical protein
MTKAEIISAIKGAAIAALTVGLYWLMIALAGSAGLF